MISETNCAAVKDFFALYLYGELSFDEEERVESHLDACVDCRKALERQREVQVALDNIAIEPAPSLLRSCREDLHYRLVEEEAGGHSGAKRGWWEQFTDTLTGRSGSGWMKPAGALTLVALGFLGARLLPTGSLGGGFQMGVMEPSASRVRYVEPASDGRVQIVLDETSQRIVSGTVNDQKIQGLLLSAAKDPADPGLRAETVEILTSGAQSSEVRNALLYALLNDKNAGVRLKVMTGLKPFVQQPEVRSAMTQVLLHDPNPEMRSQAIDLMTKSLNQDNPAMSFDRQVIGAMQELMQRESNAYVRQRCKTALESVKASTETY
jgi:putative zinc finger protein/HEAT repeat protein